MIGIQNVNNLKIGYYAATLMLVGLFSIYDIRHHRVRNQNLLWLLPWCLLSIPLAQLTNPLPFICMLIQAVLGFFNGGMILFLASIITNGGIGGGDIKLAALLGIIFGTGGICTILTFASVIALFFVLLKPGIKKTAALSLPFVPFLFLGLALWLLILKRTIL